MSHCFHPLPALLKATWADRIPMTETACRSEITAGGQAIRNPNPNIYLPGAQVTRAAARKTVRQCLFTEYLQSGGKQRRQRGDACHQATSAHPCREHLPPGLALRPDHQHLWRWNTMWQLPLKPEYWHVTRLTWLHRKWLHKRSRCIQARSDRHRVRLHN